MSVTASIAINESTPIATHNNMVQIGDVESGIVYLHIEGYRACDPLVDLLIALAVALHSEEEGE